MRPGHQRAKILAVARILLDETDETHPLSLRALIEKLAARGIPAERKGLYEDIRALAEVGLDVAYTTKFSGGWYVCDRPFELAEVKLLVDVVQAARFLSPRKSRQLIEKLGKLTSPHEAKRMQRQVFVNRRTKSTNEQVLYHVDTLHEAILRRRVIRFHYFDYNREKQKVLRHDGAQYVVSPKALLWNHEKYYLAAHDHRSGEMRHYRVDKMQDIEVTEEHQRWEENGGLFDTAAYSRGLFGMYQGRTANVQLRCAPEAAGLILDQFGMETILVPEEGGGFTTSPEATISPPFWGWLFSVGDQVQLTGPHWVVELYKKRLKSILSAHTTRRPRAEKKTP